MDWKQQFEREFFLCAGSALACKQELVDWTDGTLPDGGKYDKVAVFVGELSYGAEMVLLCREHKRAILRQTFLNEGNGAVDPPPQTA